MEVTRTTVHNQPGKNNKTMVKIDQPRGSRCGGGGGAIGVGIIILGGAVAAAAFIFNQKRRKTSSSNSGKKGHQSTDSSPPVKIIQDKYINEDKGLQFVPAGSSARSDKDQGHQHLRNETSSNGVHDQKQNGHTMVSDETSFFKQDEKGKGKLEVNEDILSNSPQVLDHSLHPDPSLMEREIQTPIQDEGKTLLQPTIQENEQAMQEIAFVRVNGQYIQVNVRGEETKVNSWESKERSTCNGDLLPPISEIEEEASFQPMSANISMPNGCEENALEIQVAVLGNNDEDEDLEAANEEEGKGQEDITCTKSSAENGDNEEHGIHFRGRRNRIQNEALKVTDKFQIPEGEANSNNLLISEAPGVAEEVIVCSEAEGKEETEMTGERIHETREKAELPNVGPEEPQMDTIETALVEGFQDDNSDTDEPTSVESNVIVPEFDADNGFKPIQPSAENSGLEKENVYSEVGFEGRVEEIEDSPIQLDDEDRKTLKEAEDAVITEEQKLTRQEEDDNNDMDESSTSEKVEESSEGTVDSFAESNAEHIWPAEANDANDAIQSLPTELEEMEANDANEIVELPSEEENVEKLNDISTQEKGLQNCNEEKGNIKLTVLERYVVQLQELALEATHPQKRRKLVMAIMASSGSLCLYFGMDFLQICLIFILSMMLFEMQGI